MEKFRSKILACILAVALVVLTTPIGLNFDTESKSIEIQSNKAHAVVPVAGAAAAFLAEIAAASGLTVGEFVATVVGMAAVGTGIGLATDAGINYGNAASVNLGNLIDAADYPAWDTLTTEQQEDWGTKENYDSAKFNSLLDAFDLGDARERFYSSSGGNIDYTSSETSRLEQLGRIGQNWINNGSNSVNSILDAMSPQYNYYVGNYIGRSTYKEVNKDEITGWPSGLPDSILVNKGNYCLFKYGPRTYNGVQSYDYFQVQATDDVYFIICVNGSNVDKPRFGYYLFSKSGFNWGYVNQNIGVNETPNLTQVTPTNTSVTGTYNGNTYYYDYVETSGTGYYNPECTMAINNFWTTGTKNNILSLIPLLLFNDEDLEGLGSNPPNVIGYPEDIQDDGDTNVYFPTIGINPGNTWQEFTTAPEENPGTGGDVDLSEIIELLQRFHFTVDYNLLVQDNPLRSAVMELVSGMNRFSFYAGTGQLKVHDEGVFDAIGDMGSYLGGLLTQIQATLSGFFVTDTATDVIGDLDFPDLGDKAVDLVDTISTLAPFGAMFLISELVAILSQVGKIQSPSLVFDFNFMPGQEYDLTVDVSWLDDAKPIINVACIVTLIVALAGATARLIELEAAA